MRQVLLATAVALVLIGIATPAAAQVPSGGYYSGGSYYAPGPAPDTYFPSNNETAYDYGVYAVAPGFGPYLRLGGEGGWNPNLGSTYNSYPGGDYYSDYGLPFIRVAAPIPYLGPLYRPRGYGVAPYCWPGYPICR